MYDPTIGRWLEDDPTGFLAGDVNLKRYCGNNPTNRTDPTGLESKPVSPAPGPGAGPAPLPAADQAKASLVGGPRTLVIVGWGEPHYRAWLSEAMGKNSVGLDSGLLWPWSPAQDQPKDLNELAADILKVWKLNGKKPFDRIQIHGHCGGDYGLFSPGVLIGDSSTPVNKDRPESFFTSRLQLRACMASGGPEGKPDAALPAPKSLEGLITGAKEPELTPGGKALRDALKQVLKPGGYLQVVFCGHSGDYNAQKGTKKAPDPWGDELQGMSNWLEVPIVASRTPITIERTKVPGTDIEGKDNQTYFQSTGKFMTEGDKRGEVKPVEWVRVLPQKGSP